MKVINISYNIPKPQYKDPEAWLERVSFSVGVLEKLAQYAETSAIYNIDFKGTITRRNVTYYFPRIGRLGLVLPFRFNTFVKRLNPDVIIVHGLIFPWQVLLLRAQIGGRVKIIMQHHAEKPLKDIRHFLQRRVDKYVHAYLFASIELARPWQVKGQIRSIDRVHEVMGTSSPFHPIDRLDAKQKTGVQEGLTYLWVGSLNANKDPLTVARAFREFIRIRDDARLYMIYQTFQLLHDLRSLVEDSGISDHVILLGQVKNSDLLYWYNSADFIISSSHYEGSGIAVCEGMSCGCIPILTNIPSFRTMTSDGSIGVLYEPGRPEGLLNALEKSLTLDREVVKAKVLKRFREDYSFEANAQKILQAINQPRP